MKMKKNILALLLLALQIFATDLSAQVTPPEPVFARKSAEVLDANHVKLTLESFVSGNNVSSDIAILMDLSASMNTDVANSSATYSKERKLSEEIKITPTIQGVTAKDMTATAKPAIIKNNETNNTNFSYTNVNTNSYFYLYKGVYYPVQCGNNLGDSGNIRALWIETLDGRFYLNGQTLSDTPGTVTTNGGAIFSGILSQGYTWANIAGGTNPGETPLSYLYKGEYYPVKRHRFDADGTRNDAGTVYALWIETPEGVKFLRGAGIQNSPDASINNLNTVIYYGGLYQGWTYADINGPWYLSYGGVLYPVHKSQEGPSYTLWIMVNGVRMYLNGKGVSDHYVESVYANNQSIYFGSLYNGGWKYNDLNGNTTYSYLYEGNYYQVHQGRYDENLNPANNGRVYALYVEIGGSRKFLSGNALQDSPYELVTSNSAAATGSIFSGTLYSGGWAYNNTGDASYYLHEGAYYNVKRSKSMSDGQGNDNVRALWIELPGGQIKYLNGQGLSDDYLKTVTSDNQGIYFGTLYSGGWTYTGLDYGDATGRAGNQYYYLHTDGQYYPVRRANNLSNGNGSNNVRAMWICLDPSNPDARKYLSGQGLADDYVHTITANDQIIYQGPLYKGWTYADVGTTHYYKYEHEVGGNLQEDYLPVYQDNNVSVNGNRTYQLYVTIDGNRYYLNGNGITKDVPNPNAAAANNISLYFGDLYLPRNHHRKGDYLNEAVIAMLEVLHDDSVLDNLHHRVPMAQFNSSGWSNGNNTTAYLPYPHLAVSPIGGANAHLVSDFKDIYNDDNFEALKDAMALPGSIQGVSHYEWGLSLAKGLFQRELGPAGGTDINNDGIIEAFEIPTLTGEEHTKYAKRPKIVVIIGDCQHNGGATADDDYINALKADGPDDINALVFVVFVGSNATAYQNALSWASRSDLVTTVSEFDDKLVTALRGVAREIREALIVLGGDTVFQDVIADGFEIPDETDDVKVFTADHVSGMEKETMVFADRVPASGDITLSFDTDGDGRRTVKVSGFDYSENFCGTLRGNPHGKKLILEIEVERTSAVGGPSTVTNAAGSGMKYSNDGDFVFQFENPTMPFPVDIVIQKDGLAKGESAVFNIQPVDGDGNPITSVLENSVAVPVKPHRVILTGNAAGTSVTASLKHLNGHCNWLVSEEGWSWDYVANSGNSSISTATQILNPFVFTNVKQDTTIKAAESKVTNDFKTGTATTVNSKVQ